MNIKIIGVLISICVAIIISMAYLVKSELNARVRAEVIAAEQKTRARLAESQLERVASELSAEVARQSRLAEDLRSAREEERKSTEVLEDRDRLKRIAKKKPTLLERKARRATRKAWIDIENLTRE